MSLQTCGGWVTCQVGDVLGVGVVWTGGCGVDRGCVGGGSRREPHAVVQRHSGADKAPREGTCRGCAVQERARLRVE